MSTDKMTAPTPAAVIGAMARSLTDVETVRPIHGADYESSASIDRRTLASHIRAIAEEMREVAKTLDGVFPGTRDIVFCWQAGEYATHLRTLADKLEGKE